MSSPAASSSKPVAKRRRAYVACVTCRKRKIKCVTASDADDDPCTRCKKKGIPCEFIAVPDEDESSPGPGPTTSSGYTDTSQGARLNPASPYPQQDISSYPYNPNLADYQLPPHPPTYAAGHARGSASHTQLYYGQHGAPFYNSASSQPPATYAPGAGTGGGFSSGPYYASNADYPYATQFSTGDPAYLQWSQGMPPTQCICPPGPCYCGANFDAFNRG